MSGNENRTVVRAGSLFIGCGGTGFEVIKRLKQQVQDNITDERILQSIGFLVFDTEPYDVETRSPLAPSEYVDLSAGQIITSSIISRGSRLRQQGNDVLRDWWYEDPKDPTDEKKSWTNPPNIQNGAGQRPPLGRLALYAGFDAAVVAISQKIGQINNIVSQMAAGSARDYPINAYVVSSLAGGTGRGAYLDIGILTNHLLRSTIGGDPEVWAFLLDGKVFQKYARRAVMNTASGIYELLYFSEGKLRTVEYPRRTEVSTVRVGAQNQEGAIGTIFKRMLFYSDVDTRGLIASSPHVLYEKMARSLFPLTLSAAGAQITKQVVNGFTPVDKDHLISALACRVIEFPDQDIKEYFFLRTAAKVLNDYLLQNPGEDRKKQAVDTAIVALKLDEDGREKNQIQDRLMAMKGVDATNTYGLSLSFEDYRQSLPGCANNDADLLDALRAENNKRLADLTAGMEARTEEMLKGCDLEKAAKEEFTGRGAAAALSLLHGVKSRMDAFVMQLSEEKKEFESSTANAMEDLQGELERCLPRFMGVQKWRGYFSKVGIGQFNAYYESRLEMAKRDAAIGFITRFESEKLNPLIKRYENLRGHLEGCRESTASRLDSWKMGYNSSFRENPVVDKLLSADDIVRLYDLTVDEGPSSAVSGKSLSIAPILNGIKDSIGTAQSQQEIGAILKEQIESLYSSWIKASLDFSSALQMLYPNPDNPSELSPEAKRKMKAAVAGMIEGLALPWPINASITKPDQYFFAFVGPNDAAAGGASGEISKKWLDLFQDDLDTFARGMGCQATTYGVAQKPEKYFTALLACSSIDVKGLLTFDSYLGSLQEYFTNRQTSSYNQYNPIFIDRKIEEYAFLECAKDLHAQFPWAFVAKAVGYGVLRSVRYDWVLAFGDEPEGIASNSSYSATLTGKEEYLTGLAKEFENVAYVYTFPNRPKAKCLLDAVEDIVGKEALKKAVEEECNAFEVRVSRENDTLAREHSLNRAIGVVDDFVKNAARYDDVGFWQVLRSELVKLKG